MSTDMLPPHTGSAGAPGIRPLVNIAEEHVYVEPGQTVTATATIHNVSGIVETYDLSVLGPAAPWIEVNPRSVSLFPGEEAVVDLNVQPPRSSTVVAGDYVVGLRAASRVNPEATSSDEADVSVAPFYDFDTDIARSTFAVKTKAKTHICVSNKGNSTVTYEVSALDPEGYVKIVIPTPTLTLAPGESVWIPLAIKVAPRVFGTTTDTRTFNAHIVPVRDDDAGIPIIDPEVASQQFNLLHRPIISLRMGLFGRLVVLIGILALIAAFVWARIFAAMPPPVTGAPPVPQDFAASLNDLGQPVLTWSSAPGATGYTIYAIGAAGDPVPQPTPTIVVPVPVASPAVAPAVANDQAMRITFAVAPLADSSPSPSATFYSEYIDRPSPVCENCTEIGSVDAGTTRFVVEQAKPGESCYRIAAKTGDTQSLYSPPTCIEVADPNATDSTGTGDGTGTGTADGTGSDGSGGADGGGAGGAGGTDSGAAAAPPAPPVPCPPIKTDARALSTTSIAILWKPATKPPKGMVAPEPSPSASDPTRGGPVGKADEAAPTNVCDPEATITGWSIQRKILSGWSDVSPEPKPNDSAVEITDLQPDTKYCFRMLAKSANGDSKYTKKFCTRTDPEPTPTTSATPMPAQSPSTATPVQDNPA